MNNEDPAPDLSPDESWGDDFLESTINHLAEVLYEHDCHIDGMKIIIPSTPGKDFIVETDFGKVSIEASGV